MRREAERESRLIEATPDQQSSLLLSYKAFSSLTVIWMQQLTSIGFDLRACPGRAQGWKTDFAQPSALPPSKHTAANRGFASWAWRAYLYRSITPLLLEIEMKATLGSHVIAESNDIVESGGYQYFPTSSVRMEWLQKAAKTESDHACPHGVQFYDVVIDGERHERAAWSYEAPLPAMEQVAQRFGFWNEVKIG
jgi:uncharacterized protein (DUF427 family)